MNRNVTKITNKNISQYLLQKKRQYFGFPQMPFQFEIGETVVLKAMATEEGRAKAKVPGFKRSLSKCFFIIIFIIIVIIIIILIIIIIIIFFIYLFIYFF